MLRELDAIHDRVAREAADQVAAIGVNIARLLATDECEAMDGLIRQVHSFTATTGSLGFCDIARAAAALEDALSQFAEGNAAGRDVRKALACLHARVPVTS